MKNYDWKLWIDFERIAQLKWATAGENECGLNENLVIKSIENHRRLSCFFNDFLINSRFICFILPTQKLIDSKSLSRIYPSNCCILNGNRFKFDSILYTLYWEFYWFAKKTEKERERERAHSVALINSLNKMHICSIDSDQKWPLIYLLRTIQSENKISCRLIIWFFE